ncbi:hypothetical protein RA276_31100, partial [Pseudomonas syringae pv. tagetis]
HYVIDIDDTANKTGQTQPNINHLYINDDDFSIKNKHTDTQHPNKQKQNHHPTPSDPKPEQTLPKELPRSNDPIPKHKA